MIVRDKEFEIELVNNYVHQLHEKMVQKTQLLVIAADDLQDEFDAYKEQLEQAKTKAEIRGIKKNYREVLETFDAKREKIKSELVDIRSKMLKEIIERNHIEYDAEWWEHETSPDDINSFILACIEKDIEDKKKVKAEK